MKVISLFIAGLIVFFFSNTDPGYAQSASTDVISTDVYSQAPEHVRHSNAFNREKWFYEQRAYPNNTIPIGALERALKQKARMNENGLQKGGRSSQLFSYSDWKFVGPSMGATSGRVSHIAIDSKNTSRVFIGAATGGVWRSTDKGSIWVPLTDRETSLAMGSVAIDPTNSNIIYAGTGEAHYSLDSYYGAGILKSYDGGNSWTNISVGIPLNAVTSCMLVSGKDPSIVIAALATRGIYRSVDAGATWIRVLASRVDDIVFHPQDHSIVFGVGGDGTGLIRSTDGGATWGSFGNGFPQQAVRVQFDICRDQPTIMYASTYGEGGTGTVKVYKSTNTGVNWSQVGLGVDFRGSQAWYDFHLRVNPSNPQICFVGTVTLFRTTDGGTTWKDATSGIHVDQHDLQFDPVTTTTIYAANDGGMYKSTDGGNTWGSLNGTLALAQFYRIANDQSKEGHILGGTQDNGTQQTWGNIGWSTAFGCDGGEVSFSKVNSNYIIGETQAGGRDCGGLVFSTNGGNSWTTGWNGIPNTEGAVWVAPIVSHPSKAQTFFHGRSYLYKTDNAGKTWETVSQAGVFGSSIDQVAISNHPTNPVIYCTSGYRVVKSTDGGVTFATISSLNLPNRYITSIYTHPHPDSGNVVFVTTSGFGGDNVWRTNYTSGGWISIAGNLPDVPCNDLFIHPDYPQSVYAVATDIGVFFTENGGKIWAELSTGLPNTVVHSLDYNAAAKKLRAGTHGRSVWEITLAPAQVEPPVNLVAAADRGVAIVSWNPSPTPNVITYSVYRGTKTGTGEHVANVATNLAFTNTGLENNTTYYYRVRAVTVNDSSVFSAEVAATPKIWQGCIGKVLTLNSLSQNYVLLPSTLNSYDALTVEGWVWWKTFRAGSRFVDLGTRDRSFLIGIEGTTNTLVFQVYGPTGANEISAPQILSTTRPVHVAAVSGKGGMKLYVDGILLDTHPYTGSIGQTGATTITNYIGRSNWGQDQYLNGDVDEVRIWSSERSADQIKSDYNRILRPDELADPDLIAYYNFDTVTDSVVTDLSLKKNNAKLVRGASVVPCSAPVSVAQDKVTPLAFALHDNHPNPFSAGTYGNPTTTISFTLDQRSDVTLEVYNLFGQKISTLINHEVMDAGEYAPGFDGSSLTSGVYIYVLRAGDRFASKRMMLIK